MSEKRSAADHYRAYGPATKAIHAGYRPDPATGVVNAPIYASSTFAQDGVGGLRGGFEYARTGNPTRAALETSLAAVELADYARAFSSGMAATDCALRAVLRPGDHVVIPDDAYGEIGVALTALKEEEGHVEGYVDTSELARWARRNMAEYKAPRVFQLVRKIPRNAMGKVNKKELRHMYLHGGLQ